MCIRGELLHDSGEVADSMEAYRQAVQLAQSDSERVSAWIGLVAGMRIADRYDEGLEMLDSAEKAASGLGLDTELSRIHHLRGNLYFPLGRIEDCKKQHELALEFAQRVHSLEDEARALGGLGDAYYAQGRMRTAHEHFQRCVSLCRAHGFGRIEVANLSMAAITRVYFDPLHLVADAAISAIDAATKVAHQRAEVIAQNCALLSLTDMGELDRAKGHLARLEALVRHLGARRFEVTGSVYRARIALMENERAGVLELLRNVMKISRDTGVGFAGPRVLGTLAMATRDPEERQQALQDGEDILRSGAVGHNHFLFYRDAIEASLSAGDRDGAKRYAAALEDYTRPEPLPWTDFFIARGRALAAFGRGDRHEATTAALERLRDEAERLGLVIALPAIERALVTA
jgi:tetratricopeptide (TPR) repeat protein